MRIKRFEAKNMSQALKMVKQELGSEAVILSARSFKNEKRLFGSFKRKGVEVTAAVDSQRRGLGEISPKIKDSPAGRNYPLRSKNKHLRGTKAFIDPSDEPPRVLKTQIPSAGQHKRVPPHKPAKFYPLYLQLLSQGFKEELVTELTSELLDLTRSGYRVDRDLIKKGVTDLLEKKGVTTGCLMLEKKTSKVAAIIGQPGVGKTTTIAKLTAEYAIQKKNAVAVFTLDGSRIGAAEQLNTYANIIKVPLEILCNPGECEKSLFKHRDRDLILIDTPAISLGNEESLDRIKAVLDTIPFIETHLVLAATTKERDLIEIFERLKTIAINRLIFSKLDESVYYGNLMNQLIRTRIPVSYLTNGRSIPENIEAATLEKIADMFILQDAQKAIHPGTPQTPAVMHSGKHPPRHGSAQYFIANQNSDIYHVPACKWNRMIKAENIIVFDSMAEAEDKQFKPCRSCRPDAAETDSASARVSKRNSTWSAQQDSCLMRN